LERDLDSTARFQASPTGQPQSAPAASDAARAGVNRVNAKTPPTAPVIVHAATPQRSPAAEDDAGALSGTSGKISVHLPISYPIETVSEITGIPRTKIFEAVRTKKLTARDAKKFRGAKKRLGITSRRWGAARIIETPC
jgi:hypothetical protein